MYDTESVRCENWRTRTAELTREVNANVLRVIADMAAQIWSLEDLNAMAWADRSRYISQMGIWPCAGHTAAISSAEADQ